MLGVSSFACCFCFFPFLLIDALVYRLGFVVSMSFLFRLSPSTLIYMHVMWFWKNSSSDLPIYAFRPILFRYGVHSCQKIYSIGRFYDCIQLILWLYYVESTILSLLLTSRMCLKNNVAKKITTLNFVAISIFRNYIWWKKNNKVSSCGEIYKIFKLTCSHGIILI